jgi:hypothetical protein
MKVSSARFFFMRTSLQAIHFYICFVKLCSSATQKQSHSLTEQCTCSFAHIVHNYWNFNLPGRWIGTGGPVTWPPRSPDFTPLNFFLWGYVKDQMYSQRVNTPVNSKHKFLSSCKCYNGHIKACMTRGVLWVWDVCRDTDGSHCEAFLI